MAEPTPSPVGENHQMTFAATLVDEWVRQGVTDAVVCPGSRSTPLAVALAASDRMRVHVCLDERSGAFVALGLGVATGRAAIVLTTSGTAAVELHPAVVEAHQSMVPMLAVTADRPPELQGVGAPQTIDQQRLFGTAVRWFCEPGPPEPASRGGWRYLAADTIAATRAVVPGPVHLNLAFREPLLGPIGPLTEIDPATDRPEPPAFRARDETLATVAAALGGRPGVIVAGARTTRTDDDREAVTALAEALGWPVLADHLSGCRVDVDCVVGHCDPILRHGPTASELRPSAVLRIGGLHASRVVNEWLTASGAAQVGLDRYGHVPDPDGVVAQALHGDVADTARSLAAIVRRGPAVEPGWMAAWRSADRAASTALASAADAATDGPIDEVAAARIAVRSVPSGGALVVSSSMPVRDLEWYGPPVAHVTVVANRGANGIDGVVSTAVGVALSGSPTVALLGDVAFLHDSSALTALARREVDLAVVVIDNDGGGIFSFLPQAAALADADFELLFGTPHGTDLVALARAHGLHAATALDAGALERQLAGWRADGGIKVIVVPSDRRTNAEVHARLNLAVAAELDALGSSM